MERFASAPEREAIGAGAIENEEDLARRLENILEKTLGAPGPWIVAVTGRVTLIGFGEGSKDFRANAGVIVARKMTRRCLRVHGRKYRSGATTRQPFSAVSSGRFVTKSVEKHESSAPKLVFAAGCQ